jgi:hypothetical protein
MARDRIPETTLTPGMMSVICRASTVARCETGMDTSCPGTVDERR